MSKRLKLKRIKWGIFLILVCFASTLTFKINAQTVKVNDDTPASAEQTTCKHDTCTKSNIKTIYNPIIENTYNEDTQQEVITIKINKTKKVAKFYYVIADIRDTGHVILKEGYVTNTENKIDYPVSTKQQANIEVVLALEEAPECATDETFEIYPHDSIKNAIDTYLASFDSEIPQVAKIDDKKCRYALFTTSSISIDYVEDTSEENESLKSGGLCHSFRNGLCDNFSSIEGVEPEYATSLKAKCKKYNPTASVTPPSGYATLDKYYESALEYCYNNTVDVNYSDKTIATMINNAMISYIADTSEYSTTTLTSPTDSEEKTNPSTTIKLTCDKNIVSDSFANTTDPYVYTNSNKYHHTDTTQETATSSTGKTYTCEKKCQEEITVQYGPPVAVKAGLCFEYQVKVESKVTCTSKFTGEKPKKSDYTYCTPTPICNSTSNFFDQGGPSEDFDACVNECDGGKYSQSCINKCYDEVYGTEETYLGINYNNQVTTSQISNSMLTTKAMYTSDEDIKKLMKAIANNDNCYYTIDEKTKAIVWECNNTAQGWEKYARYYFQTFAKAKQTINADFDVGYGETRYYNGTPRIWYYQGVSGYKRACKNSNCSQYCNDNCKWTGCSKAKNLTKEEAKKYLNPSFTMDDYNADMEAYNDAKMGCTTSVSCNKETTTFTIKVDNKGSSIDPTELTATVTNKNWTDTNNIIIENGQCYKDSDDSTNKYTTEWGVPGTYINNKTGAISYETKNTSNGWTYKENQFCTSLESKNVNQKWWNWRVKNEEGTAPDPDEHNITATTKDFGYYNWNFEIKCFYASYDDDSTTSPPPEEPEDPEEPAISYRVRSVDSENLFPAPDSDATSTVDKSLSGRTPGFNWTNEATDLRNPNYEITPGALMTEIQTLGTNIYSGDSYLDYQFILDTENLKKVANYKTNYNDFKGTTSLTNDIMVSYKSALIRDIIPAANKKLPSESTFGCNNKSNAGGCQTYTNDYVNTLR